MWILPYLKQQGRADEQRGRQDEPLHIAVFPQPRETDQWDREQPAAEEPPVVSCSFADARQGSRTRQRVRLYLPYGKVAQDLVLKLRLGTRLLPDEERSGGPGLPVENMGHQEWISGDSLKVVHHPSARNG